MKRKLKNKFNRILSGGGVLLSLCNVSLLGVGFSSWVAGIFAPPIEIQTTVGDVTNRNYFSITGMSTFELGPDGIVSAEKIVHEAKITVNVRIDNAIANPGTSSAIIKFNTILTSSSELFATTYINSTPEIQGSSTITPAPIQSNSDGSCTITSEVNYNIENTGYTDISIIYNVIDKTDGNNNYTIKNYANSKPIFNFAIRSAK